MGNMGLSLVLFLFTLSCGLSLKRLLLIRMVYAKLSITFLFRWKNDEIEAIRSDEPKIGEPLILAARHRGGKGLLYSCRVS